MSDLIQTLHDFIALFDRLAQNALDETSMRRWAQELGVAEKLDEGLSQRS